MLRGDPVRGRAAAGGACREHVRRGRCSALSPGVRPSPLCPWPCRPCRHTHVNPYMIQTMPPAFMPGCGDGTKDGFDRYFQVSDL